MNQLIKQIKSFLETFCKDSDTYQIVTWDDDNFDVVESIYHGAIVYQFTRVKNSVVVFEQNQKHIIKTYEQFQQLFPYIFD